MAFGLIPPEDPLPNYPTFPWIYGPASVVRNSLKFEQLISHRVTLVPTTDKGMSWTWIFTNGSRVSEGTCTKSKETQASRSGTLQFQASTSNACYASCLFSIILFLKTNIQLRILYPGKPDNISLNFTRSWWEEEKSIKVFPWKSLRLI